MEIVVNNFQAPLGAAEFSPRRKSLCENLPPAVIPSGARNLALSIFKAVRDASSSANKNGGLLGMTGWRGFYTDSYALG